ncbi:MAG: hypothetical protein HC876_12800 [Chloroflexaceae bacterium]|nr:hypothetical protein [Chloroflexaceae bacterium]
MVALDSNPARYAQNISMAAGAQQQHTMLIWIAQSIPELVVTVEQNGMELARYTVPILPQPTARLMAVVADPPLQLALPDPATTTRSPLLAFALAPANLPTQPLALDSLTLVLLNRESDEALTTAQQQALLAWVRQGGHLILSNSTGSDWLPPDMQPAEVGSTVQLDTAFLAALIGTPEALDTGTRPDTIAGNTLRVLPGGEVIGPADAVWWVQRDVGLGRVTQLAFAPADLDGWISAPLFWNGLFAPAPIQISAGDVSRNNLNLREQRLTEAATMLPAPPLPPLALFAGVLLLYLVIVGPGAALLLWRIDRLAWAWVVLPGLALLFLRLARASRLHCALISASWRRPALCR